MTYLKSVMLMTPEEINRAEWRVVAHTLRVAQQKFADIGHGRQAWMDAAIALATERGEESQSD